MSDINDSDITKIVNAHSDAVRGQALFDEIYSKTCSKSVGQSKISYNEKKKKKRDSVNRYIAAVIIFATLIGGSVAAIYSAGKPNNGVSVSDVVNEEIDDRIAGYVKLLGMYNLGYNNQAYRDEMGVNVDKILPFENFASYDDEKLQPLVYYNQGNMVANVIEASKHGENEVRCMLIAAYKVVNDPYISNEFDKIFQGLTASEEYQDVISRCPILNASNSQEFLNNLGYENWDEYKMNERDNIKVAAQLVLDNQTIIEGENDGRKRI